MRSLIILEVEHGEDTDAFYDVAEEIAGDTSRFLGGGSYAKVIDYTVRVDLPECFVLDTDEPVQTGTCQSHTDIHYFSDECVGWKDYH